MSCERVSPFPFMSLKLEAFEFNSLVWWISVEISRLATNVGRLMSGPATSVGPSLGWGFLN